MRPWVCLWISLWLTGCASAPRVVLLERIGGVQRMREFASPTAYEAYLRAEVAVSRGELDVAGRQLDLAELADPEDGYLSARHAEVLLRAGDLDGAETTALDAVRNHPTEGATWIALAEVRSRRGDTPGALAAVHRAAVLDPDDADVRAAVTAVAGGDAASVARARDRAPGATAGDHAASWGAALAPEGDPRRTTRARARQNAHGYLSRGQWSEVDRVLSPLVDLDPGDVTDRLLLLEARVRDGRPRDAARLVPGVPIGVGAGAVTLAVHARLWLQADRPELAREEAERAVHADAADTRAVLVLGEALLALGGTDTARGITVLAAIPPGTEHYASARVAAARAVAAAGFTDVADAVLDRALAGAMDPDGRDRLRAARGALRMGGVTVPSRSLGAGERTRTP